MKITIYLFLTVFVILFSGCASSEAFGYVKTGNIEKIKELVNNNKVSFNMVNEDQNTLFDEAVYYEKFDIANYLLSKGVKINEVSIASNDYCKATIHKAAGNLWSFESLKYLVENGADVNLTVCNYEITPLLYAVNDYFSKYTSLQIKKAKYLLDNGANINAKSHHIVFRDIDTAIYSDRMREFINEYRKSMDK